MNKKEVFIKNPMRGMTTFASHEVYVPEYQRLISENKLSGSPVQSDLSDHQSQVRSQIIKELQMSPKLSIPSIGQQDIGWNKQAAFYDEPLSKTPVYDDNLVRDDVSAKELSEMHEKIAKEHVHSFESQKSQSVTSSQEYKPPTSLDQLNNNEIIIILKGHVVFSSLEESEVKDKIASLIFEENNSPDSLLVIKRLPVSISINLV